MFSLINICIIKVIPFLPKSLIKLFANRYVAGTTISEACDVVKSLNSSGQSATLDILGEHTINKVEADKITDEYIQLLEKINLNNLDCNLSIKPSHLGSDVSEKEMFNNFIKLQEKATLFENFIRLDMENSTLTDLTIEIYKKLAANKKNTGLVFQAYLNRSLNDINNFKYINIRLCKGIYNESEKISIKDPKKINENFLLLLRNAFINKFYVGIATHDKKLIKKCIDLINEMKIPNNQFEFQYLYGVPMKDMIKIYKKNDYKIRVYVPFGLNWYEYSLRRIKENPKITSYIIKNLLK